MGFDASVISGVVKFIELQFDLSKIELGWAVSSLTLTATLAMMIAGPLSDRIGRRKVLFLAAILYAVSAIASALAPTFAVLVIARMIGGLGVGASLIIAPMYIAEIAPPKVRGRMVSFNQLNIVLGISAAFFTNYLILQLGQSDAGWTRSLMFDEYNWRWMLGLETLPAVLYFFGLFFVPESPRWLIGHQNNRQGGIEVLRLINPDASESDLDAAADRITPASPQTDRATGFWTSRLRTPILLAFLIAFFNQLSGINAILYFAPRIFELTGLGAQAALLQSVGIGVTNLIFTFVGLWLIDKLGRRSLLYIGSFGYIASLGLCAWAFNAESYKIVPACIFAFIAAHAIGQGAVIWVLISEIFPNRNLLK